MSSPYIQKEVNEIIKSNELPESYALATAWIIAHFKGANIKAFNTKEVSSLCDYNVVATAENTIQAKSMVDEIMYNLKQNGAEVISVEGLADAEWILLDLGDIIVHIFQEVSRDVYDLDSMWRECSQLEIPQEYYFGTAQEPEKPQGPSGHYF